MSERRGGGGSGLPASPAQILGLPENADLIEFTEFAGLNRQASRAAIGEQEMSVCDNMVPVAAHYLRALADRGPTKYTIPGGLTTTFFDFYTTSADSFGIVFANDGSAQQFSVSTGAVTQVGTAGTFQSNATNPHPGMIQAGLSGKTVICIIAANGYFIWDGTNLFQQGTASPVTTISDGGSDYTSAPTVAVFGGSGTGVAATAQIAFGSVSEVQITSPGSGYLDTDSAILVFSGGGQGSTAYGQGVTSDNVLVSITLISGGSGFTSVPSLTITPVSGGSGATAIVTAISGGIITGVQVLTGGSGYVGGVTIAATGGGGSGATFAGVMASGVVTSVTMINQGSGYSSAPTINYISTSGAGAAGRPLLLNGQITGVAFDYPSQGGSGYQTPPIVQFVGGGGPASGVLSLMPFGVSGNDIETYLGRVWIADGNRIIFSGPGTLVDFGALTGGGIFQSTDSFLRAEFIRLKQANGFLYLIGDSSVNYISGVTTSGTPLITTFSNLNIDPQIGSPWRDSVTVYSRSIMLSNTKGIYQINGGAVQKASPQLDGIFDTLPALTTFIPSGAVAQIFSVDTFMLLMPILDPTGGMSTRNSLLMWNGKRWWTGYQSTNLVFINSLENESTLSAWGTDSTTVFQLFAQPGIGINKTVQSPLWLRPTIAMQKKAWALMALFEANQATTLEFTINSETGSFNVTQGTFAAAVPVAFGRSSVPLPVGQTIGFTMTSNSADFALINVLLIAQDYALKT